MSDAPLVSVVMPVYNEAEALAGTVRAAAAALAGLTHELILVDDGSTDGSWQVIGELSRELPTVRGLRFSRNFGHQAALLAGLGTARGAAVITMDSDGQHPPELLPPMVAAWKAGALVVQGLRTDAGGVGATKRWSSRLFYRLFSWLAGTQVQPGSADFRLLDRKAVDLALACPRSALFLRGFVPWMGLRTEYLSFTPRARAAGTTKFSPRKMLALAREGILRFSVAPLRLSITLGLLTSLLALGYLVYVVAVRLFGTGAVPGWASVVGLVALLGGVQLVVIGILGEYVGMIFQGQLGRPPYVIAESLDRPGPPAPGEDRR